MLASLNVWQRRAVIASIHKCPNVTSTVHSCPDKIVNKSYYCMRLNYSQTKLSRLEDFIQICNFYIFVDACDHQFYITYIHYTCNIIYASSRRRPSCSHSNCLLRLSSCQEKTVAKNTEALQYLQIQHYR